MSIDTFIIYSTPKSKLIRVLINFYVLLVIFSIFSAHESREKVISSRLINTQTVSDLLLIIVSVICMCYVYFLFAKATKILKIF